MQIHIYSLRRATLSALFLSLTSIIFAQLYTFPTDALQRGYYTRAYDRYEAEPSYCQTNGLFLNASDDQRYVQAEASHQQAVQLSKKGDYVAWQVAQKGKGITLRFSLPDTADGKGKKSIFSLYISDKFVQDITLDSYWAWQYTAAGQNYPDNLPGDGKMVRMRFDEMHTLLSEEIHAGATLRLEKKNEDNIPCVIDFIELEDVPAPRRFEDIADGNKVKYDPSQGELRTFIQNNGGKTIFLPEGKYDVAGRIYLRADGTKIIGAGMWYTEIYFTASSDDKATYSFRGIEASASNLLLEGVYLNTINNKRYYNNEDRYQVGKGLMGTWGVNSVVRNCWVEHFECGAWIANYAGGETKNLLVEHCRFRNNYADGINLCQGSEGHTVQYCSFRNNGDDDMASWSTGQMCKANTFAYCTAENNWRASSLGFFGGQSPKAHHLAIFDGLECGARINADFAGTGFSSTGQIQLNDITIVHCGCRAGARGTSGDFWGNMQGALNIGGGGNYNILNLVLENIDIQDTRSNGMYIRTENSKQIKHLVLRNITLKGGQYGIFWGYVSGDAKYCQLKFENQSVGEQNKVQPSQSFTWENDCPETALETVFEAQGSTYYDLAGRQVETMHRGSIYIEKQGAKTRKIIKM